MKIVTVNKNSKESIDLVNKIGKASLLSFINSNLGDDTNTIFSCIIGMDNDDAIDYCIYVGAKDTRFVQMNIEDLSNKRFLKAAVDYAFNNLDAYTITIFTDKQNKFLEDEGFENLGRDNDIVTYIKEKEMDKETGRVRI